MFPIEPLLVIAFITGSPKEPLADSRPYLPFGHALQDYCLRHQLLDPQERPNYFVSLPSLAADIRILRDRYSDLNGAPPISDVARFPPRHAVIDMIVFNRRYRDSVLTRLPGLMDGPPLRADDVLEEIDTLFVFWSEVRDAQNTSYYIHTRRKSLYAAYRMLGEYDYYNGVYPPSVPLWRFRRID